MNEEYFMRMSHACEAMHKALAAQEIGNMREFFYHLELISLLHQALRQDSKTIQQEDMTA
jgi:hypothetical protein